MNLIELHILQSFPVTCLNRDDIGAPKTAMFGGSLRARVSSQSWKRAIRTLASEQESDLFQGKRTRYVVSELKARFEAKGRSEAEAEELAKAVAKAMGKLDDKHPGAVKTLLYHSPAEFDAIVGQALSLEIDEPLAAAIGAEGDEKKYKKAQTVLAQAVAKAAKALKITVKDASDIAVFGRMVADDASLTLEGAGLFSHALSTHKSANEIDFFSAVDDKKPDQDDAGAAHIDTLEYNSATYYRYVGLNLDLLWDELHLGHYRPEERRAVLRTFIRSALLAVPGARKNSMFGQTPPSHVLGLRRSGQPISLINAFEKPIKSGPDGYLEPSRDAMERHWNQVKETFGLGDRINLELALPEVDLESFIDELCDGA